MAGVGAHALGVLHIPQLDVAVAAGDGQLCWMLLEKHDSLSLSFCIFTTCRSLSLV